MAGMPAGSERGARSLTGSIGPYGPARRIDPAGLSGTYVGTPTSRSTSVPGLAGPSRRGQGRAEGQQPGEGGPPDLFVADREPSGRGENIGRMPARSVRPAAALSGQPIRTGPLTDLRRDSALSGRPVGDGQYEPVLCQCDHAPHGLSYRPLM